METKLLSTTTNERTLETILEASEIMRHIGSSVVFIFFLSLGIALSGCGGTKTQQLPKGDDQANAKVAAIKKLAAAMAKEANGAEARGELENFRNIPLNANNFPQQADEIAEVYRKQIQGKYNGFVAQEIQVEIGPYLSRPKSGN